MKLHEIAAPVKKPFTGQTTITVEPAGGIYGDFEVSVTYYYEPASSTLHVQGDPSTREHHPEHLDIIDVRLNDDVQELDEDGKKVGKVFKKGLKLLDLPGTDKSDEEFIMDRVRDELGDD